MVPSFLFYFVIQFVALIWNLEFSNHQHDIEKKAVIKQVIVLSDEVKETSGLAYFDNMLLTHNDKGNKSVLYAIDQTSGQVKKHITILDIKNNDWEDLAQNQDYVFIGDMGNNDGNRKDLKIYKIKKDKLKSTGSLNIPIDEVIEFQYEDQQNFEEQKKHNFDCEAIIFFQESLYLFTKNRESSLCKIYKIPSKSGSYKATVVDSFNIAGLVTGAAISPSGKRIILTGYNKKDDCFLYSMQNYTGDRFFSGKNSRIKLGSYDEIGQLEGVAFEDENTLFLSSEKTKNQKAKLYKLKI